MTTPDFTQPVILRRRNYFWRVQVLNNAATSHHGKGDGRQTASGRLFTRNFRTTAAATAWATEALATKLADGYVHAASIPPDDPVASSVPTPSTTPVPKKEPHPHPPSSNTEPAPDPNHNFEPVASTTAFTPRRSSRKRAPPPAPVPVPAPPASRAKRKLEPKPEPTNASNATATPNASSVSPKRVKRGLSGHSAPSTNAPLGIVDPASGIAGSIYVAKSGRGRGVVKHVHDAMLVLVDIAKHHDKFIVLQLISADAGGYVLYERWGRTGTAGQSLLNSFPADSLLNARRKFESKFLQKTGLEWESRTVQPIPGKYRFVTQDFAVKHQFLNVQTGRWQYWVSDFVDGKPTGWYDYTSTGNVFAEQLYLEFLSNPWLNQRVVQSGQFAYLVDLQTMTQTNIVHSNHTTRHIRRIPPGEIPNSNPPDELFSTDNEAVPMQLSENAEQPNVVTNQPKNAAKIEPAPASNVTNASPAKPVTKKSTATKAAKTENGEAKSTTATKSENREAKSATPTKAVSGETKASTVAKAEDCVAKSTTVSKTENCETESSKLDIPVDDMCPDSSHYSVVKDFDAMLNQTNIMGSNNNNKYYKIQLLFEPNKKVYYVWTRWGRVGEARGVQTKLMGSYSELVLAEKAFNKKFKEKSGNDWSKRAEFKAVPGKYELVEIDHSIKEKKEEPLMMKLKAGDVDKDVEVLPSKLAKETRELIELLFKKEMYTNALREFDIDVNKMPLGQLSTQQIEKGVAVLEELEKVIKGSKSRADLERLSSKFYTTLPHDFGRQQPPVLTSMDMVQRCLDMCNVLRDMEKASSLMDSAEDDLEKHKEKKTVPNPVDAQYDSLHADLKVVEHGCEEYETVKTAFEETKGQFEGSKLLNVWRVDREGEAERYSSLNVGNDTLLWHGTHVGTIAAILATGLRIMPHSGGRVGRGIYLASENEKSQHYTTPAQPSKVACMFLAQAALGKIHEIRRDDSSLTKAPDGFDSVRACGQQAPGEYKTIELDGKSVRLPVQKAVQQADNKTSTFYQDEFLVYNEAQARLRYVISISQTRPW